MLVIKLSLLFGLVMKAGSLEQISEIQQVCSMLLVFYVILHFSACSGFLVI